MSICSTQSSGRAPESTVSANGYKFATTRSNGSTPRSSSCWRCSSLRRSASRPACTFGCRVLTRPSRHSGNPVSFSTFMTGTPAAEIRPAVDPVETISAPASWRRRASSSNPVLSYTLISARLIATRLTGRAPLLIGRTGPALQRDPPASRRPPVAGQPSDDVDQEPALHLLDALVQGVLVVMPAHGNGFLGDDGSGVHAFVDEVNRTARHLHPVRQGVPYGVGAGERRQQRGVGVDGPAAEPREEARPEDLHEAGGHHQVRLVLRDRLGQGGVPVVPGREILDAQGESGQTHSFRAGGSLDIGTVRPHGHDLGPVGWIRARVEQRL